MRFLLLLLLTAPLAAAQSSLTTQPEAPSLGWTPPAALLSEDAQHLAAPLGVLPPSTSTPSDAVAADSSSSTRTRRSAQGLAALAGYVAGVYAGSSIAGESVMPLALSASGAVLGAHLTSTERRPWLQTALISAAVQTAGFLVYEQVRGPRNSIVDPADLAVGLGGAFAVVAVSVAMQP